MPHKELRRIVKHRREPGTLVKPASRAIRCFCLECCGYQQAEVDRCTAPECHLWPYRFGYGKSPDSVVENEKSATNTEQQAARGRSVGTTGQD